MSGQETAANCQTIAANPENGETEMPITASSLRAGDVLFKQAENKLIPKIIKLQQKSLLRRVGGHTNKNASRFGVSRTHVAMAAGPNDVLEFDEGGKGAKIVFRSGHGFVRGDMAAGARAGNAYDVYECVDRSLAAKASDKAKMVWDITKTRGSRAKGQYGFSKLVQQAVAGAYGIDNRGPHLSANKFEAKLNTWLKKASRGGKVKFFCSEFVTYAYLWAASDSGSFAKLNEFLGTDQAKISPVELYHRVDICGYFRFKGVLYS